MEYGTMFDHVIEYHLEEEAKHEKESEVAFHALMDLVRPALTSKQQEEVIKLYVDATYAKFWAGWHSKGYSQAKVDASKKVSA
jgi:hypothetical protein